jgi:pimeloyl-ACP methyl ester carboxylesterase
MKKSIFCLIPGIIEDERSWKPLIDKLGEDNCIVISIPGFGKPKTLEKLDQDSFNKHIEEKLSELDLQDKELVFIGHSLGSILLIGALTYLNVRNAKFVLLSFPYSSDYLALESKQIIKYATNITPETIEKYQKTLARDDIVTKFLFSAFRYLFDYDIVLVDKVYGYDLLHDEFVISSAETIKDACTILNDFNYLEILEHIENSTLIIQGEKDRRVDIKKVKTKTFDNENIELIFIDKLTHMGFIIEPDIISNKIVNWVDSK